MIDKRVSVNGVKIYPFTSMDEMLDYVEYKQKILMAINAGKIGRVNDDFRALVNDNIGYADGIGALIAIKKAGIKNSTKIPGCELWLKIIERKYKTASFYFVGAKQEVIEAVIHKLQIDFPGINILGYRNGYIKTQEEEEQLLNDIAEKKPQYVFIAMGSPLQENMMKKMMDRHAALYQGLGGSFNVYAGIAKRAPQWLINMGLEGPYRFTKSITNINSWRRFWGDFSIICKIKLGIYKTVIV